MDNLIKGEIQVHEKIYSNHHHISVNGGYMHGH